MSKRRKLDDSYETVAAEGALANVARRRLSSSFPNCNRRLCFSTENLLAQALPASGATLSCLISRLPAPGDRQITPLRLSIPIKCTGEEVHHLSFSPQAQHLLIATSFGREESPTLLAASSAGLRIVIYERGPSAAWQDWKIAHEWIVNTPGTEAASLVDLQWLDESPAFGLSGPMRDQIISGPGPGLSAEDGLAFAAILESNDVLLCRLDAAVAEPMLLRTQLSGKTPTVLVPYINTSVEATGGIAPPALNASDTAAIQSQASGALDRIVSCAAIGFPPKERAVLIAAAIRQRPSCRPTAEPPLSELEDLAATVAPTALPPPMAMSSAQDEDQRELLATLDAYGAFNGGLDSLQGLDEAFGDLDDIIKDDPAIEEKPAATIEPDQTLDASEAITERALSMFAVRVAWSGEGGPKLDVFTLAVLPLSPPLSQSEHVIAERDVAHLTWVRRDHRDPRLSLVAISNAPDHALLQQWRTERCGLEMCEAFNVLQGTKVQDAKLEKTWLFTAGASKQWNGISIQAIHRSEISLSELWLEVDSTGASSSSLIPVDLDNLSSDAETGAHTLPLEADLAFSASQILMASSSAGRTKLAPSPGFDTQTSILPAILALNIRRSRDCSDICALTSLLPKSSRSVKTSELSQGTIAHLRALLPSAVQLEKSMLAPELFRMQHHVWCSAGDLSKADQALEMLRLVAYAQNLQDACTTSRSGTGSTYSAATLWPLIAGAAWYGRLAAELTRALAAFVDGALKDSIFLLVHPLALALHRNIAQQVSDLRTFLERQAPSSDESIMSIARTVLADIVTGAAPGTIVLNAWQALLAGLSQPQAAIAFGSSESIFELPSVLPAGLKTVASKAVELVPTLNHQSSKLADVRCDIVTLGRLGPSTPAATRRQCVRCAGLSDLPLVLLDGSIEAKWRRHCICGGMWSLLT